MSDERLDGMVYKSFTEPKIKIERLDETSYNDFTESKMNEESMDGTADIWRYALLFNSTLSQTHLNAPWAPWHPWASDLRLGTTGIY